MVSLFLWTPSCQESSWYNSRLDWMLVVWEEQWHNWLFKEKREVMSQIKKEVMKKQVVIHSFFHMFPFRTWTHRTVFIHNEESTLSSRLLIWAQSPTGNIIRIISPNHVWSMDFWVQSVWHVELTILMVLLQLWILQIDASIQPTWKYTNQMNYEQIFLVIFKSE